MTAPYSPDNSGSDDNDTPGTKARKKQLQAALQELAQFRQERGDYGGSAQGSVALKQNVASSQKALKRQQNVQAGRPALDEE